MDLKPFFKLLLLLIVSISYSQSNKIIRLDNKTFFEDVISKKSYSINLLLKELENDSQNKFQLIKKGIDFKSFFMGQDIAIENYSNKCNLHSSEIKLAKILIENKFKNGLINTDYVFNYSKKNIPNFQDDYEKIKASLNEISELAQNNDCELVLKDLLLRKEGVFNNRKDQQRILSFNYITNPVNEIQDGFYDTFSTISTAPNEDFIITIDVPSSWENKATEKLLYTSTKVSFTPYQEFLLGSVTISISDNIYTTKEEMSKENISNNDVIEMFYKDDEVLKSLLNIDAYSAFDISTTLLKNGKFNFIFYNMKFNAEESNDNNLSKNIVLNSFGLIGFRNGKFFFINTGGAIDYNGFNQYDYYSKLFFKMLTSVNVKDLKKDVIYLIDRGNSKQMKIEIENKSYDFILDTGATDITINKGVLTNLLISGFITKDNFLRNSLYKIADGSLVEVGVWLIPNMKIGNKTIKNVEVAVIESEDSPLLFGLNGIKKLEVIKLDLDNNEIKININ